MVDWLWQCTAGIQAVWALRLWSLGLAPRYPAVTAYLVISPILITAGTVLRAMSDAGSRNLILGWLWVLTQPLSWILLFVVVVEIHNKILHDFSGFRSLGQLVIRAAMVLLAVLYLLMAASESLQLWSEFWLHQQQTLFVILTLLCMVIVSFAAYWEIPISRNIWLLIVPFGLMIGGNAFFLSLRDLLDSDSINGIRSVVMPLLVISSFGTGALMFSKAGEKTMQHTARPDPAGVIGELEAMNDALKRVLSR